MIITVLIVVFVVLMLLEVPIAFAMGVAAIAVIPFADTVPMTIVTHRLVMSTDSFTLLAVPLFVLAGALMETGGIAAKLVNLAKALVGFVRGGLGMAVIVGEMFFSGISGSTTADVSAMASMLLPAMRRSGYPQEQSIAIISAASAMGILIPPCITMVVFGGMASTFGAVVGAAVLTVLPQFLTVLKDYEMMVFGALIIFFLIVEPHGLARLWQIAKEKLRLWPFPH